VSHTEQKLPIRCLEHGLLVSNWRTDSSRSAVYLGCERCGGGEYWKPLLDYGFPVPPTLEELKEEVVDRAAGFVCGDESSSGLADAIGALMAHRDWKGE
jgi:hypothetical protein